MAKVKIELKDKKEVNIKIGTLEVKLKEGVNELELNARDVERIITHLGTKSKFNELIKIDGTTLKTRLKNYESENKKDQQ